jgi:phosphoribosylglycinamide formyltransferase-1
MAETLTRRSAVTQETGAPALAKLAKICLALPESERNVRGDHADFRVRNKVFAYYLNNHHGDGIVAVCCKAALGENVDRVARNPERFYLPAYIGPRGWFGLRLDRGAVDWTEVQNVVELSYRLVAPRTLASVLDGMGAAPKRRPRAGRVS